MIPLYLLSCSPSAEVPMPDVAAGRVEDPALRAILEEHWNGLMARAPTWATALGDHRYDDRLPDASPEATAAWRAAEGALLSRSKALPELSAGDRLTAELLAFELEGDLRLGACRFELWDLSARENPLTRLLDVPEHHPTGTPADLDRLRTRYQAAPAWVDQQIANLRTGLATGRVVSRPTADLVVAQVDRFLARPIDESPLAEPFGGSPPDFAPIRSAVERLRRFLAEELVPNARPEDREGLWALPDGAECYAALVASHTSLALSPDEIHARGLAAVAAVHAEFDALGPRVLGTTNRAELFRRLRAPDVRFPDEAAVERKARESLDRANAAVPKVFRVLPKTACGVERVPDHLAPYTTIAYYDPSAADGS
jgi:uncharacterized protein (DUF885 family)